MKQPAEGFSPADKKFRMTLSASGSACTASEACCAILAINEPIYLNSLKVLLQTAFMQAGGSTNRFIISYYDAKSDDDFQDNPILP